VPKIIQKTRRRFQTSGKLRVEAQTFSLCIIIISCILKTNKINNNKPTNSSSFVAVTSTILLRLIILIGQKKENSGLLWDLQNSIYGNISILRLACSSGFNSIMVVRKYLSKAITLLLCLTS
jgi:hypothetical protein